MSDIFNFKRLVLFLRSDLVIRARSIIVFAGTIYAVLFLCDMFFGEYISRFHSTLYVITLFAGGFFVTSHIFSDLHDKMQGVVFLTLPASPFEKLLSRWLETSVGYALGILMLFSLLFVFTNLFKAVFIPEMRNIAIFHINYWEIIQPLIYYMLMQPVFLLGALYFKKSSMAKTILCCCVFVLLIFFIKFLFAALFFTQDIVFQQLIVWRYYGITLNTFLLLLAPTCLFITYLRLCESEI